MEDATEADLLAVIDLRRGDDSIHGQRELSDALAVLLSRHEKYIYGVIHRVLGGIPGLDPEDVYWSLATRLVKLAGDFTARAVDPDSARKEFLAWVGRVAALVTREMIRRFGYTMAADEKTLTTSMDAEAVRRFFATQRSSDEIPGAQSESQIQQLMAAYLTEKEREVLRLWVLAIPLDGGQCRMTEEDIAGACRALDTTPQNFRQLKSRALRKLKAALQTPVTT